MALETGQRIFKRPRGCSQASPELVSGGPSVRGLVGDQTTKVAAGEESVWEPGRVDAATLQCRAKRRFVLAQTVELAFVDMDAG
jgi:hypothetical protein